MSYDCTLCHCSHRSERELKQHLDGRKHQENERRRQLEERGSGKKRRRTEAVQVEPVQLTEEVTVLTTSRLDQDGVGFLELPVMAAATGADFILMDLPYFLSLGYWDKLQFVDPLVASEQSFYGRVAQFALNLLLSSSSSGAPAPSLDCLFFCRDQDVPLLDRALRDVGFKFTARLFWIKDTTYAAPKTSGFMNIVEHIVVASRADAVCLAAPTSNVIQCPAVSPDDKLRVGPDMEIEKCEKPVPLLLALLDLMVSTGRTTDAAQLSVADYCAGSCSLVSAVLQWNQQRSPPLSVKVFDKRQQFCLTAAKQRTGVHDDKRVFIEKGEEYSFGRDQLKEAGALSADFESKVSRKMIQVRYLDDDDEVYYRLPPSDVEESKSKSMKKSKKKGKHKDKLFVQRASSVVKEPVSAPDTWQLLVPGDRLIFAKKKKIPQVPNVFVYCPDQVPKGTLTAPDDTGDSDLDSAATDKTSKKKEKKKKKHQLEQQQQQKKSQQDQQQHEENQQPSTADDVRSHQAEQAAAADEQSRKSSLPTGGAVAMEEKNEQQKEKQGAEDDQELKAGHENTDLVEAATDAAAAAEEQTEAKKKRTNESDRLLFPDPTTYQMSETEGSSSSGQSDTMKLVCFTERAGRFYALESSAELRQTRERVFLAVVSAPCVCDWSLAKVSYIETDAEKDVTVYDTPVKTYDDEHCAVFFGYFAAPNGSLDAACQFGFAVSAPSSSGDRILTGSFRYTRVFKGQQKYSTEVKAPKELKAELLKVVGLKISEKSESQKKKKSSQSSSSKSSTSTAAAAAAAAATTIDDRGKKIKKKQKQQGNNDDDDEKEIRTRASVLSSGDNESDYDSTNSSESEFLPENKLKHTAPLPAIPTAADAVSAAGAGGAQETDLDQTQKVDAEDDDSARDVHNNSIRPPNTGRATKPVVLVRTAGAADTDRQQQSPPHEPTPRQSETTDREHRTKTADHAMASHSDVEAALTSLSSSTPHSPPKNTKKRKLDQEGSGKERNKKAATMTVDTAAAAAAVISTTTADAQPASNGVGGDAGDSIAKTSIHGVTADPTSTVDSTAAAGGGGATAATPTSSIGTGDAAAVTDAAAAATDAAAAAAAAGVPSSESVVERPEKRRKKEQQHHRPGHTAGAGTAAAAAAALAGGNVSHVETGSNDNVEQMMLQLPAALYSVTGGTDSCALRWTKLCKQGQVQLLRQSGRQQDDPPVYRVVGQGPDLSKTSDEQLITLIDCRLQSGLAYTKEGELKLFFTDPATGRISGFKFNTASHRNQFKHMLKSYIGELKKAEDDKREQLLNELLNKFK